MQNKFSKCIKVRVLYGSCEKIGKTWGLSGQNVQILRGLGNGLREGNVWCFDECMVGYVWKGYWWA